MGGNYENVDILVNNAGIIKREDAKSFSDSDFRQVLQVNLDSLFTISRELGLVKG